MQIDNVWTWSDIVQLMAGFILFLVGIWIGKTQEKSVNLTKYSVQEVKFLQTGIAELQMYEKIGVIRWGLHRITGDMGAASALLYDCLALLPVLEFSGEHLATQYLDLLYQCLISLSNHSVGTKAMSSVLADYSLKQAETLRRRNLTPLAKEVENALAMYLDALKSQDKQKAEEIFSQFLDAERVKHILQVPSGDTFKIMKILAPLAKSRNNLSHGSYTNSL